MNEFERCRPWIVAALARGLGSHTFEDVAKMVAENRAQLWPAPDGCLVTEIQEFPQFKVLNVWLGGGKLDQLKDMQASVEAFGRAVGCKYITIQGRPGWERVFDMRRIALTLGKEL